MHRFIDCANQWLINSRSSLYQTPAATTFQKASKTFLPALTANDICVKRLLATLAVEISFCQDMREIRSGCWPIAKWSSFLRVVKSCVSASFPLDIGCEKAERWCIDSLPETGEHFHPRPSCPSQWLQAMKMQLNLLLCSHRVPTPPFWPPFHFSLFSFTCRFFAQPRPQWRPARPSSAGRLW